MSAIVDQGTLQNDDSLLIARGVFDSLVVDVIGDDVKIQDSARVVMQMYVEGELGELFTAAGHYAKQTYERKGDVVPASATLLQSDIQRAVDDKL